MEDKLLGHVLPAEDAQTAELYSMFARLDNDVAVPGLGGIEEILSVIIMFLCGGTPGEDFTWLNIPDVEGVPSAEMGLGLSARFPLAT